jgi:TRAP-type C4-dicarboxylate transport system permease large subunit
MAMMIELGLIHPPVGLNLFIIHGLSDRPMKEVILGALPYCFITLIGLLLIYIFPDIVLFLPNSMR